SVGDAGRPAVAADRERRGRQGQSGVWIVGADMSVPSVETKIFEAIAARVRTLPMLTGANAYDLVWTVGDDLLQTEAGAEYEPSPSKRYIRATWTPNQVSREGRVDGSLPHRRPGILQLDVYGLKTQL